MRKGFPFHTVLTPEICIYCKKLNHVQEIINVITNTPNRIFKISHKVLRIQHDPTKLKESLKTPHVTNSKKAVHVIFISTLFYVITGMWTLPYTG